MLTKKWTLAEILANLKAFRQSLGMNQGKFWGDVFVTQSGGSRDETGRRGPTPIPELLRLRYVLLVYRTEKD